MDRRRRQRMFKSKIFTAWYFIALLVWICLFVTFDSIPFLIAHWYYPITMVAGAFVAGFTPEGGGAVAFPVLSVFLKIDRVIARDFAMMIQSVGMTSASIWILTQKDTIRRHYRPCLVFVPLCVVGATLGFQFLQKIPVYIIQALFLSLSATFVVAFYFSDHRGIATDLKMRNGVDHAFLVFVCLIGGMVSSLFGTGGDILVYMLLITWFNMVPKLAVRMSIVLQASISVFGYLYRHFYDHGLQPDQFRTWLCAFPVVLFMAPFGAYVLARLHVNWMLRFIIAMNIFQLLYFNLRDPSMAKVVVSVIFTTILGVVFFAGMRHVEKLHKEQPQDLVPESTPV